MNIEYSETGDLRLTHSLWLELIEHHAARSTYFSGQLANRTIEQREEFFAGKAS